jgi:hypothetical protein
MKKDEIDLQAEVDHLHILLGHVYAFLTSLPYMAPEVFNERYPQTIKLIREEMGF